MMKAPCLAKKMCTKVEISMLSVMIQKTLIIILR